MIGWNPYKGHATNGPQLGDEWAANRAPENRTNVADRQKSRKADFRRNRVTYAKDRMLWTRGKQTSQLSELLPRHPPADHWTVFNTVGIRLMF